jgi:hypothetical protein
MLGATKINEAMKMAAVKAALLAKSLFPGNIATEKLLNLVEIIYS